MVIVGDDGRQAQGLLEELDVVCRAIKGQISVHPPHGPGVDQRAQTREQGDEDDPQNRGSCPVGKSH